MRALVVLCTAAALLASRDVSAQDAPVPVKIGDVTVSGNLRARVYSWDWFGVDPGHDYTYPAAIFRAGLSQNKKKYDWQLEFSVPVIVALPTDAVLPAPKGQLGLGGSYYAANSNSENNGSLFLKQAAVRFKELGGIAGQSIRFGRFEFGDGAEVAPKNPSLAALKRDRIGQRLLGTFGFTDVQRSFDGALYTLGNAKTNLTVFGARPTEGVFQVDGWGDLKINVFYAAVTRQISTDGMDAEWRAFVIPYRDYRSGVAKVDNRPAAVRNADTGNINVWSWGGHFIGIEKTSAGPVDVLLWGVFQTGAWGSLTQRSGAFAAEAGWQPQVAWSPWIRGGYDYGSGDGNPNDQTHGTFFTVLYTPRVYSRTPFFNQMNNTDLFAELILRPTKRISIRSDVHAIDVANSADFWYTGGGAFQSSTFGYAGRAVSNQSGLATLVDVGPDVTVNAHTAFSLYYGHASGGAIPHAIYSSTDNLNFFYLELGLRF